MQNTGGGSSGGGTGGGSSGSGTGGGSSGGSGGGSGGSGGNGPDPNTPPSGTIGWTPEQPTNPHQPPQDPCEKAKADAERLDSIWQNSPIDSALGTISNANLNRYEYAFNIILQMDRNPNGPPHYINPRLTVGQVETQYSNQTVTAPSETQDAINGISRIWLGFTHTHTDSGVAAPSPKDIYKVYEHYVSDNRRNAIGNFVRSSNGGTYVIKVNDEQKAAQFFSGMRDNVDTAKNRFKDGSELGNIFAQAEKYFLKKFDGQTNREGKAFDMATAAVLSTQNTGITLFRQNSAGKFEPLILTLSPNPRKPSQLIFTNGCN
ncbi:MAG: hypothetical protein EAY72_02395 [Bacteroidetes bacterium]|nr:MAG: hypothetical protein EAY72_02395 [Bacteroidota bacterium]